MLHHMPPARKSASLPTSELTPAEERSAVLSEQLGAIQDKVAVIVAGGESYGARLDLADLRDDLKDMRDDIAKVDLQADVIFNAQFVDQMIADLDVMSTEEDFLNERGLALHDALWSGERIVGGIPLGDVAVSGYVRADGVHVDGYTRRHPQS